MTLKPRGGEPRAVDTATPSPRPTSDAPTSQIHSHDDGGPFWVVTCICTWASVEITDPVVAVYVQALHDLEHAPPQTKPTRPGEVMSRIRKARQQVAEFYAKSAAAQPGEVWTASYFGSDFQDNYFESYTAGVVRILGDECPVEEYRGRKTLGEADLDPETSWPWSWVGRAYLFIDELHGAQRRLDPGDVAPDMSDSIGSGDVLAALPNGACVTVEYRNAHPVYAGLRNVVTGTIYDHDERGRETGRDVGGDWVPFAQVTAVICHSHAEVAS